MARSKGGCSDLKGIAREFSMLRGYVYFEFAFFTQIVVWITLKTKQVLTAITICRLFSSLGSAKVCVILLTDIQKIELYFTPLILGKHLLTVFCDAWPLE